MEVGKEKDTIIFPYFRGKCPSSIRERCSECRSEWPTTRLRWWEILQCGGWTWLHCASEFKTRWARKSGTNTGACSNDTSASSSPRRSSKMALARYSVTTTWRFTTSSSAAFCKMPSSTRCTRLLSKHMWAQIPSTRLLGKTRRRRKRSRFLQQLQV